MTPGELSGRAQKSFDFAQEVVKQILTLSTGVFALTLTFAEKIEQPGTDARGFLEVAWGFYLAAILFGIVALMSLAGHLDDPPDDDEDTIYTSGLTLFAGGQVVLFFIALILTLVYGAKAT